MMPASQKQNASVDSLSPGGSYRNNTIGPVLGQTHKATGAEESALDSVRRTQKRRYCAFDLYFLGFAHMPLKKIKDALAKTIGSRNILKVSFVRNLMRITVWKECRIAVARKLTKLKFYLVNADPLDPRYLATLQLDNRTREQKVTVCEAYYRLHCKEVLRVLRYRVAKREQRPEDEVKQVLAELQSFNGSYKTDKVLFKGTGGPAESGASEWDLSKVLCRYELQTRADKQDTIMDDGPVVCKKIAEWACAEKINPKLRKQLAQEAMFRDKEFRSLTDAKRLDRFGIDDFYNVDAEEETKSVARNAQFSTEDAQDVQEEPQSKRARVHTGTSEETAAAGTDTHGGARRS